MFNRSNSSRKVWFGPPYRTRNILWCNTSQQEIPIKFVVEYDSFLVGVALSPGSRPRIVFAYSLDGSGIRNVQSNLALIIFIRVYELDTVVDYLEETKETSCGQTWSPEVQKHLSIYWQSYFSCHFPRFYWQFEPLEAPILHLCWRSSLVPGTCDRKWQVFLRSEQKKTWESNFWWFLIFLSRRS